MATTVRLLCDADADTDGEVLTVVGDGRVPSRLRELGLTPGTVLRVLRRAPLGAAIVIHLRGFTLALRRDEAALVRLSAATAAASARGGDA